MRVQKSIFFGIIPALFILTGCGKSLSSPSDVSTPAANSNQIPNVKPEVPQLQACAKYKGAISEIHHELSEYEKGVFYAYNCN